MVINNVVYSFDKVLSYHWCHLHSSLRIISSQFVVITQILYFTKSLLRAFIFDVFEFLSNGNVDVCVLVLEFFY